MDANMIALGTKLEIKIPYNGNSDTSNTYTSQLIDIIDRKTVSIAAPISEGKFKYLNMGLDLFVFFLDEHKDFLFFNAIVKGHRKNGPIEAFDITITSEIKKLQRREAYRLDTALSCKYTIIDSRLPITESSNSPEIPIADLKTAATTNISSNGISLHVDEALEAGTVLYIIVDLEEGSSIKVIAQVKRSHHIESKHYMAGLRYIKIDSHDSQILTKFIFAKQRLMLKNKMPSKFK
ncbi:c-di-GMP-binding flagellar brake protein YcgR [Ruminiclostridium sufflavum DSM 19573]|uniref:C-di-GMP-binding flagellar brake protein YcgR n=1 Tax=Ruminiclostridium sufflavum DSM 19573 TaxID=1121337 RepID=A0A318XK91_9FIRM|nr:flagellar brake domain-containing protein [Ruminiclostridium sufflavum]PYG86956.1 c-di-GMP-binding flagellar brake protein YcgR [Ruminiclostridium sufflavum DSM 19573]